MTDKNVETIAKETVLDKTALSGLVVSGAGIFGLGIYDAYTNSSSVEKFAGSMCLGSLAGCQLSINNPHLQEDTMLGYGIISGVIYLSGYAVGKMCQ